MEIFEFIFRTRFARPGSLARTLIAQLLPGARHPKLDGRNERAKGVSSGDVRGDGGREEMAGSL
jgi:hypothetical protein